MIGSEGIADFKVRSARGYQIPLPQSHSSMEMEGRRPTEIVVQMHRAAAASYGNLMDCWCKTLFSSRFSPLSAREIGDRSKTERRKRRRKEEDRSGLYRSLQRGLFCSIERSLGGQERRRQNGNAEHQYRTFPFFKRFDSVKQYLAGNMYHATFRFC